MCSCADDKPDCGTVPYTEPDDTYIHVIFVQRVPPLQKQDAQGPHEASPSFIGKPGLYAKGRPVHCLLPPLQRVGYGNVAAWAPN